LLPINNYFELCQTVKEISTRLGFVIKMNVRTDHSAEFCKTVAVADFDIATSQKPLEAVFFKAFITTDPLTDADSKRGHELLQTKMITLMALFPQSLALARLVNVILQQIPEKRRILKPGSLEVIHARALVKQLRST